MRNTAIWEKEWKLERAKKEAMYDNPKGPKGFDPKAFEKEYYKA